MCRVGWAVDIECEMSDGLRRDHATRATFKHLRQLASGVGRIIETR